MKYVYLLQSVDHPEETYVGLTDDLKSRFVAHNAGRSPHTAKFKPWRLVTYIAFSDGRKAVDFRTISENRFWKSIRQQAAALRLPARAISSEHPSAAIPAAADMVQESARKPGLAVTPIP